MVETPIWQTLIIAILTGGAVTSLISYFVNILAKKRENYYEISKHKMNAISQSLPIYGKLGSYYSEFSTHLSNLRDVERALFCACKILFYEDMIFEKFGTVQLDDIEAEEIISSLEFNIGISYITNANMRELITKNSDYKGFHQTMLSKVELIDEFKKKFEDVARVPRSVVTPNVEQKCRWYSELIFIEINEIYQLWYNVHPVKQVQNISADLRQYLLSKYPNYFNRIHKWETGGYLK